MWPCAQIYVTMNASQITAPAGQKLGPLGMQATLALTLAILFSGCGRQYELASDKKTLPLGTNAVSVAYDDQLVRANILFQQGKLRDALAATKEARKLDAKRFESPATAALVLHALRKTAEAKAAVDEALELAPPD